MYIDLYGCALYYDQNDSYVSNVVAAIRQEYANNPNSPIGKLINDPYSNVYIKSERATNSNEIGTLNGFNPNPNNNYYDMTTITLDLDHSSNKNYSLFDKNGNIVKDGVSLESIFIHELRHAYDFYYNPNYNTLRQDELNQLAIEEANKYRESHNQPKRASYE